jgi:hypothetical protein
MRRDQTEAMLRHSDSQPQARLATQGHAATRGLAQPASATANIRATVWLIACLLLVWTIIVAT